MVKVGARKTLLPLALAAAFGAGVVANQAIADQPMMHQALNQLHGARDSLMRADPDKGGHRGAAIQAVDAAIHETELGMQFARDH